MIKQIFNQKNSSIPADKTKLKKAFKNYLAKEKHLSDSSIRNYLVDLDRFIGWLDKQKTKNLQQLNNETIEQFKSHLSSSDLAKSTIKRRLSTIRAFCQMGVKKGWFEANFAKNVTNPSDTSETEKILADFESWLKAEGASESTIKNYISDVRGYLSANK